MAKRTASAKKQARAGARRTVRNRAVRSSVKTLVVKARRAMSESPVAESDRQSAAVEAVRALDRAAAKGIVHPNNAARRKSRLARQLAKVAKAAPSGAGSGSGRGGARKGASASAASSSSSASASPSPKKK
jgi:small subunit ribosomal protein S20